MKTLSRVLLLSIIAALVGALSLGCSGASSSSRASDNVAHPKEYYEGWWACSGYERDGIIVSFNNMSSEERETFPYLDMDLEEGQLASVNQTKNGSGESEMLLFGEWKATDRGISIDGAEFFLEGDKLVSQQGDTLLYFERCISGSQLNVDTITFGELSFDAPIDLAYVHDGVNQSSDRYNIASSRRTYGPSLMVFAKDTDAQDITELTDYFAGHEDSFKSFNGINYAVIVGEQYGSTVDFVAEGKWYTIDFSYFDEDPVDYSDYAATFYTTISIGGAPSSGVAEVEPPSYPEGAISWQEASQHIGETVSVYGPVVDADYAESSNGQPTFIDLGAAYPDASRVTLVVWGENRGAFPDAPESMYAGKTLCVTGEIYVYNDACNIKVTSPSQVQVM